MSLVNAKKRITGADTHVLSGSSPVDTHAADLTGSGDLVSDNANTGLGAGGPAATSGRPTRTFYTVGQNILSVTVTTPTNPSIMVVTISTWTSLTGNGGDVELKRDSTVLDSYSTGGGAGTAVQRVFIDESPTAGSNTYDLECRFDQQLGFRAMSIKFISLDDTHAASLIGSAGSDTHALGGDNTQDTNASDSLP